jgi:methylthioribose-1-phosphate isomerase
VLSGGSFDPLETNALKVDGRAYRTIWLDADGWGVDVIDQRWLPHEFRIATLRSVGDAATAIRDMWVRGAPLIGVTAAYGVALAMREDPSDRSLDAAWDRLNATRPTAINLRWALDAVRDRLRPMAPANRAAAAYAQAAEIADEDVAINRAIGRNGLAVIRRIAETKASGEPVNILTHCNAGWLACVDWGTALSPIYHAHNAGVPVHIWVDETRPRNQGAALTAFELGAHGVPHTVIADNAGGHLMQHGQVDLCIVGCDRLTAAGDAANKIGTYLKALAAKDNGVPFYVALPLSTVDWTIANGVRDIPIEERSAHEVTHMTGLSETGEIVTVQVAAPGSHAANPGFDVTPARLITGLMTERGIAPATRDGLASLFPEMAANAAE